MEKDEKFNEKRDKMETQEFSEEAIAAIINAPLAIPFEMAQTAFPPLTEFTQSELNSCFKDILSSETLPIGESSTPYEFPFTVPFDLDEDLIIFTHLKNKEKESFNDFMKRASTVLKPHRTAAEINERIEFLRSRDEEEILDKIAEEFLLEKLFFLSQTTEHKNVDYINSLRLKQSHLDQCRCAVDITPRGPVCEEANNEIDDMHSKLSLIASSKFQYGELAMLRSEENYYIIRQASVLLGRAGEKADVDIDISYNTDPHCTHISRKQAVLSFQPDFEFYLANIGNRGFRVNGEIIPPGVACKLPSGAILDFSGALFIFIPNEELIQKLRSDAAKL